MLEEVGIEYPNIVGKKGLLTSKLFNYFVLFYHYNHNKSIISNHLKIISKCLDVLLSKFDNVFLMGGFNAGRSRTSVDDFC